MYPELSVREGEETQPLPEEACVIGSAGLRHTLATGYSVSGCTGILGPMTLPSILRTLQLYPHCPVVTVTLVKDWLGPDHFTTRLANRET